MPFFPHKSDDKRRRQAELEARRAATVEAFRTGKIPPAVLRRLEHVGRGAFTSTLSVSDALLMRQAGFHPLTHVTGSAVFSLNQWSRPTSEGEVVDLQVWNEARSQALQRLRQAAEAADADAVVDVRLSNRDLTWADAVTREYTALGTAVQVEGKKRASLGLTTLSGQDFWKMYTAGWWPCGVVGWTTVYRVPKGYPMYPDNNEELVDSSRGMRHAAHLTIVEVHRQVRALNAQGLVGAVIDHGAWEEEGVEVEPEKAELLERPNLYCRFDLVGTAVARYAPRKAVHVQPVLWLNTSARA
jgi:uncharacterized protein YbjQ (UPF0145 family)